MKPVPFFHRFSFKIIAGLIAMLFLVGIPFFFIFLRYHRSQLLETLESSTTSMSRVLTYQLEVSILERRQHELGRIVDLLVTRRDVRNIMVIDAAGRVAVSSDKSAIGKILSRNNEPGCLECHRSVMLKDTTYLNDVTGRPFYRSVNVIQNRPACFSCHDPKSSIIGIFVMDFSQDALKSGFHRDLIRLLGIGGAMLILTIAVLYLLLNHLVLRRLRGFADAAEQIGAVKFGKVVPEGRDEFGQLAAGFNMMSRKLESALKEARESKDYLEKVINNVNDEIVVLNRSFDVVTANAAYIRNNRTAGNGAGRHEHEACACGGTFRDGKINKILQTIPQPDGRERYVEVFCSPLRNAACAIEHVIEVRRDITERKELEANLIHTERLHSLGLLASGLSHEINNPLASISTFVEGLKRRLERAKEPTPVFQGLEHSLGLIQREIERAKGVTHRLLVLAQKDEEGRSLVDLNTSLDETISLLSYEASNRGMRFILDKQTKMPTLRLSESQTRQVFMNLLLNSLQAGHSGGCIRCRTWHGDGRACISIEDDGIGIEGADLKKIFEPFFSRKPPGQGTGLGLFICKSILSSWGGEIEVESRPGEGSTFTLWIPVH
jgi:signal transduction histidine kinase/HAMP domain-containing protein